MVTTQFDAKIQILRSDNGHEYKDTSFQEYLGGQGIIHQTSCVDTLAKNGVGKRKNMHLLEVARSVLFTMHVPKVYWGDVKLIAAYLINKMPLVTLNFMTPWSC